ncbi:MAG: tetratricopeptide repeat protein [Erythrobacter sp.]|nr:tetratricopeptide repeat protein [Erythrobacter sp.]
MNMPRHILRRGLMPALMLSATLLLAGCESSEEKAERYYLSGMELLAAGDEDRALVEFRNVFKYNGFHKEARKAYADTQLKRGAVGEAYSQYLRLIEQYPDTPEVRQILAEIAISRGDWEEAERHGRAAIALTPDAPGVQGLQAALDYRTAIMAKDDAAKAVAVEKAQAVLGNQPDNKVARRIVIDHLMNGATPQDAMPQIELALQADPGSLELQVLKFRLLALKEDVPGTGAQLKAMFELFPDNQEVRTALIGWYMLQKDFDGAEAFLRKLAGEDSAAPEGHLAVVQLLQAARGSQAALDELDRLIAANTGQPNADLYTALRATIVFEQGQQPEAIAAMEALLKAAPVSDQTRRIKGMLARMLVATGNQVGARARVEEILAEDASNVDALKLRAGWLIEDDKPGAAIIDLRNALNQNPRDAATLTLMAQAHERDGSPELAGERLALAVEVSGSSPPEALRYAQFLQRQGRASAAEAVLVEARRVNPADLGVLTGLASIWLTKTDWPRVQEMIGALQNLQSPEATKAAQSLQAAMMLGQNRTEDGIAMLQSQIDGGSDDARTVAMIVQTHVRSGNTAEARRYMDEALAKAPEDPGLQMISASLHALMGQIAPAEQGFRALIAQNPKAESPVRLLYSLLVSDGRPEAAAEVLNAGLAAMPASNTLRWIKAGETEKSGDITGAIAIYEALYAEDSNNVVIANNLASLITTHFDDAASLDRAFAIARRLRGSDVPAFQDTYGWIEFRRGNLEEARANLEPAAAGLPEDPLAQFHLGMTYAALNRPEDAKRLLTLAVTLAGDSPLPQFQTARETLAQLEAK